jgi:hypothetical protein
LTLMVKCPRCNFAVDETTRTTCPLCFTPINVEGVTETAAPEVMAVAPEAAVVPEPPQVAASAVDAPPTVPTVPITPAPSEIPMPPQQAQPQVPVMPPPAMPQMPPMPPQQQQMPGMQQMQGGGMPQPQAVPQAPQYAPGSAPRPGVRVSLTGEVIEEAAPAVPPPSYVGGAVPPPRPTAQPANTGAGRRSKYEEAPGTTQGNTLNAIILTVMFVAFVGIGGWYYLSSRTNPKDQTTKYLTAVKQQDWKTLYTVIDLSEEDKKRLPDAAAFEKEAKEKLGSTPLGPQMFTLLKDMTFTVSEPTIEGEKASVPIVLNIKFMGQEQKVNQTIQLVNHGGWKVTQSAGAMGGGMMGGGGMGGMVR